MAVGVSTGKGPYKTELQASHEDERHALARWAPATTITCTMPWTITHGEVQLAITRPASADVLHRRQRQETSWQKPHRSHITRSTRSGRRGLQRGHGYRC